MKFDIWVFFENLSRKIEVFIEIHQEKQALDMKTNKPLNMIDRISLTSS